MQTQEPRLYGIAREEIQSVIENALRDFKESKTRIIYLDASYLYSFDLSDFDIIKKFNMLGRYDLQATKHWHVCLERWLDNQTVVLGGRVIKPIQISRTFDRVVNEGLEMLAGCVTGEDSDTFPFRGIGEGVGITALPSDTILADEINRIDVTQNPDGGSISRDGSTIYSIGNHPKGVPSATVTECGMFSTNLPATDIMFEHSVFETPITHVQDADVIGSTSIIYMCST